eukprot:217772-Prymnesium_polylepis.1
MAPHERADAALRQIAPRVLRDGLHRHELLLQCRIDLHTFLGSELAPPLPATGHHCWLACGRRLARL